MPPNVESPVINKLDAVAWPPADTLNVLDDINDAGSVVSFDAEIVQYGEYDNDALPILAPPIVPPASAVIVPCIITSPSLLR